MEALDRNLQVNQPPLFDSNFFDETSLMENTHDLNIPYDDVSNNNDGVNLENGITKTAASEVSSDDNDKKTTILPLKTLIF